MLYFFCNEWFYATCITSLNKQNVGKDYELQAADPLETKQYERINTHLQNKNIVKTLWFCQQVLDLVKVIHDT